MRYRCFTTIVLALAACQGSDEHEIDDMTYATEIAVTAPSDDAVWRAPETEVMESQPVQFAITLTKELPTPGYRTRVDIIRAGGFDTGEDDTLVARVEHVAPDGVAPTVMTPTRVRFPVGSLRPGSYRLSIEARFGDSGDHAKEQVVEFRVR